MELVGGSNMINVVVDDLNVGLNGWNPVLRGDTGTRNGSCSVGGARKRILRKAEWCPYRTQLR